jgi:hypothetical protein
MSTVIETTKALLSACDLMALCGVTRKGLRSLLAAGLLPPPLPRRQDGKWGKRWWSAAQVERALAGAGVGAAEDGAGAEQGQRPRRRSPGRAV